jgi:hypothetical protein
MANLATGYWVMKAQFDNTEIINEDELADSDKFFRIALSPIGGWFGVYCQSYEHLEDALEKLGAWCDDNAKGYIVDATELTDEEIDDRSFHFVNGAMDCALDLGECMRDMVQEYSISVKYTQKTLVN